MALGIDIYRYQTVTDPAAVKRAEVSWAYVKGTDGGGPAIVKADNQVKQMKSAGIPVGLYHYAQLTPSPEEQARVLDREVKRLGANELPPALDLEDPHTLTLRSREFADKFFAELRKLGYKTMTLYANTSMLTAVQAHTLPDDVVIWEANYSVNDGRRHTLPNRAWRRSIHQYTSVGTLSGISGRVDLNESFLPFYGNGESTLSWTDKSGVRNSDGSYEYTMKDLVVGSNKADWMNHDLLKAILEELSQLREALTAPRPVELTEADKAALVAEARAGVVEDVADEVHRRMES